MQEPSDKIGTELKRLIDKTLDLRRSWEQRRLEAENQIKALDIKITAYQIALKDYWEDIDFNETRKRKQ